MFKPGSFSLWLLQILTLTLLLIFFLWLSLRPSSPSYSIIDFSVPAVATYNLTNSSVSVLFEFSNDNKGGSVCYDNISMSVYTGKDSIGTVSLPSFSQGHEKRTQVPGMLKGTDGMINGRVMEEMVARIANRSAEVRVGLVTVVRYRIWWWRSRQHWMNVEVGVGVGVDGKISGKKKKIKMHRALGLKRWRKYL